MPSLAVNSSRTASKSSSSSSAVRVMACCFCFPCFFACFSSAFADSLTSFRACASSSCLLLLSACNPASTPFAAPPDAASESAEAWELATAFAAPPEEAAARPPLAAAAEAEKAATSSELSIRNLPFFPPPMKDSARPCSSANLCKISRSSAEGAFHSAAGEPASRDCSVPAALRSKACKGVSCSPSLNSLSSAAFADADPETFCLAGAALPGS
mmetsp:Transcript_72483/g.207955  ORF Transcript_72483/g.207955 Transcript_72483/m.207955 type:complete len:214 (+) Transcript_72483:338-979(+)